MNYRFRGALIDFFATGDADAERFDEVLGLLRMDYPDAANDVMFNLIGSHDTERFLTLCGDDLRKMKLAVLFQMTYPGSPCIYYGDEIGLTGRKDPDCRKTFKWDPKRQNRELFEWYGRLVALRNSHPSLRYGDYLTLLTDRNRKLYGFARDNGTELAVVVINNDVSKQAVEIDTSRLKAFGQRNVAEARLFRDALTGKTFKTEKTRLTIPAVDPKSGLVLFLE
jgi:glycosidase